MREWFTDNLRFFIPFFAVGWWLITAYWIALISGWRLLAQRFRMQGTFLGQMLHMQSAQMRLLTGFRNALTIGADATGLFIVPFILFRAWHPALFIPWVEITAQERTDLVFFKSVELTLGRSEEIPFRISAKLAAKLQTAAGPGWPVDYSRALAATPPPIG